MHGTGKTIPVGLASIIIFLALFYSLAFGSNVPPVTGDVLPEVTMKVPQNAADRRYLGLEVNGFFTIPQIKAAIVIIEIFSMYCPHCQKEAPEINRLYRLIEANAALKDKIKVIGIGAGNSSFEVAVYKKKYRVPFPLFPDDDFSIHKRFGEVRTPYFLGVAINDDGTHRIFHSQLGKFQGAGSFLELLLQASGLKQEK
jgi:thiol-disulfide isomerase/thioredoxin